MLFWALAAILFGGGDEAAKPAMGQIPTGKARTAPRAQLDQQG